VRKIRATGASLCAMYAPRSGTARQARKGRLGRSICGALIADEK